MCRRARASYRDCIGEQTSGRGVAVPGDAQIILPQPHTRATPHTSFECASLWRRPGPCMILVRVRLISGRLNLTRRRIAREIKTGYGPEGAIDPVAFPCRAPPSICIDSTPLDNFPIALQLCSNVLLEVLRISILRRIRRSHLCD